MIELGDLNASVENEVIDGRVGQHKVQEEMKVANDYWRCGQSLS